MYSACKDHLYRYKCILSRVDTSWMKIISVSDNEKHNL